MCACVFVCVCVCVWVCVFWKFSDARASKFRLKFSGFYVYFQLFHFNCIEKNLYIVIRVKLLNLNMAVW